MRSTQRFEDSGCGRRSAEGEYYFSIRPHVSKLKQKIEGKLASGAPTICSFREFSSGGARRKANIISRFDHTQASASKRSKTSEQAARPLFVL